MEENDTKWISFQELKMMQILQELEELRWWEHHFYHKDYTEEEWNDYISPEFRRRLDKVFRITPMKYKPHRGSLEETMKEVKEFKNTQELTDYLEKECGKPIREVTSEFYAHDYRIGWELYCVKVDFGNGKVDNNYGFLDTKI